MRRDNSTPSYTSEVPNWSVLSWDRSTRDTGALTSNIWHQSNCNF